MAKIPASSVATPRSGEQRIRSLTAPKAELQLMIEECGQGYVANCRVIEVLADHVNAPMTSISVAQFVHSFGQRWLASRA